MVTPWHDLPERYPPYQTCHRRFQRWAEEGVLDEILRALAEDLKYRGGLDLSECFIDATFMGAKKGEDQWERTKRGKGTKLMALADASGIPISICTASASPHEVTGGGRRDDRPAPEEQEVGKDAGTQDGRKLRRYKIERLFAWLHNFRRLVIRYERRAENYLGFVRLGCIVILLRYL